MLAAAKPATPMRLQEIAVGARVGRVGGVVGELGGLEAGAVERLDQVGGVDAGASRAPR